MADLDDAAPGPERPPPHTWKTISGLAGLVLIIPAWAILTWLVMPADTPVAPAPRYGTGLSQSSSPR